MRIQLKKIKIRRIQIYFDIELGLIELKGTIGIEVCTLLGAIPFLQIFGILAMDPDVWYMNYFANC